MGQTKQEMVSTVNTPSGFNHIRTMQLPQTHAPQNITVAAQWYAVQILGIHQSHHGTKP